VYIRRINNGNRPVAPRVLWTKQRDRGQEEIQSDARDIYVRSGATIFLTVNALI